jgi:hypothetical protein
MGKRYKQFSLEERCELARLRADGDGDEGGVKERVLNRKKLFLRNAPLPDPPREGEGKYITRNQIGFRIKSHFA